MDMTEIFAAYLPQYHEIEENNKFWGEGYTDWMAVKKSKPLYVEHYQPREPLNDNYYDLSDVNSIRWQAEIARKYGITGFNIYHYWFKNGHQVLQKPAEIIRDNKDIDIKYFFSWDNTSWVRSWSNVKGNAWAPSFDRHEDGSPYLLELSYQDEEQWKKHFEYLLPFFKDERYLKVNGKPVFAFMTSTEEHILLKMGNFWRKLAEENGLLGLYLISGSKLKTRKILFDEQFLYEPRCSVWVMRGFIESKIAKLGITPKKDGPIKFMYDYDKAWAKILKSAKKVTRGGKYILCGFVGYDDSPRRGINATAIVNQTPEKFEKNFTEFYKLNCEANKPFLLLTAWNEWGEGAYLEPDKKYGYAYLEAVQRVLKGNK